METLIIILSLVVDSFVTCIGYSAMNIKIPLKYIFIINIISILILSTSIFSGNYIESFLPSYITKSFSFLIFFVIGIYKLFEGIFKKFFSKFLNREKPLTIKIFDFKFAFQVYIDEIKADFDKSKQISLKESIYLALALSLDSFAVGLGISFLKINSYFFIMLCFVFGVISFVLGSFIGKKFINKSNIDLSWLAGICLLLVAFMKL